MSAMKAPSSRQTITLASRALRTVGIIMILATLLDILIFLIPFQGSSRPWLINTASQIADRGIIPMIGMALLLTAYWIDGSLANPQGTPPDQAQNNWQDLRFWVSLLATLLGALFLLLVFLHPNTVRLNYSDTIEQINQEAGQAETQLNNRLGTEVAQQRSQIDQLIAANDDQLNQAVQSKVITAEQATQIREFKKNPASVDPYLKERESKLREQLQTQVGIRKTQALDTARTDSIKSGLRIGFTSLLLAIGYGIIGWTGLKMFSQSSPRRPSQ
jgi:hypothetical protein